ncbi:hypothetical protein SDC9_180568 [bioreactor metagenome]|uniref:Uncharacterized protein n=1 Tax=bioreactor metagenome TaxID=1076179 RepID=A0A645H238_9ZZZZ
MAILIGGVEAVGGELAARGVHDSPIRVGDFELDTRKGRSLIGTGAFLDDQAAHGLVAELQGHRLPGADHRRLRHIIQKIPRFGAGLLHDQRGAGLNPADEEAACAVRHKPAVGITHNGAVRLGNQEFRVG